jgi:hypothetical protein
MENSYEPTQAQIARVAIQKLYITMKHLFFKGHYKPMGNSGESMVKAMLELKPEIYGSIADPYKVELNGLLYIFQRLPKGIEECRNIHLISREGYENTKFTPIIPSKRRRNCYRVDEDEMFIEMTRGRSDIYDILTHLTFMYIEAEKIKNKALDATRKKTRAWDMLEKYIMDRDEGEDVSLEVGLSYLSSLLGRTFEEVRVSNEKFSGSKEVSDLFNIVYWLGKLSIDENVYRKSRNITFSTPLQERLGSHQFGEMWADRIKNYLKSKNLLHRPIHIISANMHSVMNALYAPRACRDKIKQKEIEAIAEVLSRDENRELRNEVSVYAELHGMTFIADESGTNIPVQIFDTATYEVSDLHPSLKWEKALKLDDCPVIIVMDYAFGEQAYETLDELLKPYDKKSSKEPLNVQSINIMGKAGILTGGKGDIMVPTAHVFEGSTDNYPFENSMKMEDLEGNGLFVCKGPMITVLGTSLQNKPILQYFMETSWGMIGLEMEGAHYQKAIQVASKIRKSIDENVTLRYAYYASDNPLETGSTLASGSLGLDGVKPTYLITISMLNGIFG